MYIMKYIKVLFITLIVCIFEIPIFCIAHTGIGYNNLFISFCIIYAYCIIGLGLIYVINKLHINDIKVYNATICGNEYKSIQKNLFNDLSNLNFWCKIEYILHSRFTKHACDKLCNKLNKHGIF